MAELHTAQVDALLSDFGELAVREHLNIVLEAARFNDSAEPIRTMLVLYFWTLLQAPTFLRRLLAQTGCSVAALRSGSMVSGVRMPLILQRRPDAGTAVSKVVYRLTMIPHIPSGFPHLPNERLK